MDESLLDDARALAMLDSRGGLMALASAGAQVREEQTRSAPLMPALSGQDRPRAVVVSALGGSSVVADVIRALVGVTSPVVVATCTRAPLPGWVGGLDLVAAVSLSGTADGPVQVVAEAGRRGCDVVTVSPQESPLAFACEQARGRNVPVGAGRASSRTALWSLLTPLLVAARALDLIDEPPLDDVADRLDEIAAACAPSVPCFENPAKELALQLADRVPVVLGDGELTGVVATRLVSMLARTARIPAMRGALPDQAGDVVATIDGPFTADKDGGDLFADPFLDPLNAPRLRLVVLRDGGAREQSERDRVVDAVCATASHAGVNVSELTTTPGHPLVRLAGLMATVDFAATYLALGNGLDPLVSDSVTDLRERTRPVRPAP